jgi:hypothetical protein
LPIRRSADCLLQPAAASLPQGSRLPQLLSANHGDPIEETRVDTVSHRGANPAAKPRLQEEAKRPHGPLAQLVQLGFADEVKSGAA